MGGSNAQHKKAYAQGAIGAFWHVPSVLLPCRGRRPRLWHVPTTRTNHQGTCPAIDHLSRQSCLHNTQRMNVPYLLALRARRTQRMLSSFSRGDGCVTSSTFKDASHILYYGAQSLHRPRSHRNSRARAGVKPEASSRKRNMRMQAAEVAKTFDRLDSPQHRLATYPLRLPRFSSEVSSSSESSESEDETNSSAVATDLKSVPVKAVLSVCQGKACQKRHSGSVLTALSNSAANCSESVVVQGCKCLGQCKKGPAVRVQAAGGEDIIYVGVKGVDSALNLAAVVMN